MKKLIAIIILFTFLSPGIFSQSNFKNGFIITNNSDTIFGLVKNNGKKKNSLRCNFKKDSEAEIISYNPGDIKAYRFIDGKYYVSRSLNSSNAEKVFLEFLFEGITDLYFYSDKTGEHYLVEKNNEGLEELKNETLIRTSDNDQLQVKYEKESNEYMGVLKNYFLDGPLTLKKVEGISLSQNSLINIAQDYHNEVCPDMLCTNYRKNNVKPEYNFGIITGLSVSDIRIYNTTYTDFLKIDSFSVSLCPSIGIFVNIHDASISERLSLHLETTVNRYKFSTEETTLNIIGIKMPVVFKYTFDSKYIQPSLLLGLAYQRLLYFNSYSLNYDSFKMESGKDQLGITTGFETAYKINSGQSIFLQLKYERLRGHGHFGQFQYLTKTYSESYKTDLNNIFLTMGIMF